MPDTGDRSHFEYDPADEEVTTGELLETSRRLREESRALMQRIDRALEHGGRRAPAAPEAGAVTNPSPAPAADSIIRP